MKFKNLYYNLFICSQHNFFSKVIAFYLGAIFNDSVSVFNIYYHQSIRKITYIRIMNILLINMAVFFWYKNK